MPDVGGLATGLVGVLTLIGGGIAWWVRRHDSNKDPLPKQTAALAQADKSVALMRVLRDEMRGDMTALRIELAEVKATAKAATTRVTSLEETVENLDDSLTDAVRYIEALLRHMRNGSHGPAPAIPERLRGLIDPMLHRIEGEPPATH